MHRTKILRVAVCWLVLTLFDGWIAAAVVVDGSIGKPEITPLGPAYSINYPLSGGELVGTNLFHSFSQFNVDANESVNFTAESGHAISNIFVRITGAGPSTIDGPVTSGISGANLFLINPYGVIFGPAGSVSASGTFAVVSADSIHFSDGKVFSVSLSSPVVLSTAAPVAFGFLKPPGPITINGPTVANTSAPNLNQGSGASFSIIGGQISITNRQVTVNGRINIVSVASAGEVQINPADPKTSIDVSGIPTMGQITLAQNAQILDPGNGGVLIRAGALTLNGSEINDNTNLANDQGIDIAVSGAVDVESSKISSQAQGFAAGPIDLKAGSIDLNGTYSNDSSSGSIDASVDGAGTGAPVNISVGNLTMSNNGSITGSLQPGSTGNGGDISVIASNSININGTNAAFLTGIAAELQTATTVDGVTTPGSTGNGGIITIQTPSLQLIGEGQISSTTKSFGNAGPINITAGQIVLDGENELTSALIEARVGTDDKNQTGAPGAGGQIAITANSIQLLNGGAITASTYGTGDGGGIQIRASNIAMSASNQNLSLFDGIFARAASTHANAGNGGDIAVNVSGQLTITGTAQIATTTVGSGSAGTVNVFAGNLTLSGGGSIESDSTPPMGGTATGNAGSVFIGVSGTVGLEDGGMISVAASDSEAGNVMIGPAQNIFITGDSTISAQASEKGGGDIILSSARVLALDQSQLTASAHGNGGSITIDPQLVVFNDGDVSASAVDGAGGAVNITASDGFFRQSTPVDVSSVFGVQGTFALSTPPLDLTGALVVLSGSLADLNAQLEPTCSVFAGANSSTLIQSSNGGLPPQPGGWMPVTDPTFDQQDKSGKR
jgi:filamentous hemagglutinin family protein